MQLFLANESDRWMAASALRPYAEDCRKFAALNGTLGPDLANGAAQADRLAAQIEAGTTGRPLGARAQRGARN
jgi:hypothetical protein